jgi:hypothetical protein
LWIIAGVLAAAFLVGGVAKLVLPRKTLAASGFGVLEDFSAGTVKAIGVLEVLAAAGLLLPAVFDTLPVLVPLAAVGVVLLMIGAIVAHLRRREAQVVVVNLTLLALAALVAWGRFGPQSFTG